MKTSFECLEGNWNIIYYLDSQKYLPQAPLHFRTLISTNRYLVSEGPFPSFLSYSYFVVFNVFSNTIILALRISPLKDRLGFSHLGTERAEHHVCVSHLLIFIFFVKRKILSRYNSRIKTDLAPLLSEVSQRKSELLSFENSINTRKSELENYQQQIDKVSQDLR